VNQEACEGYRGFGRYTREDANPPKEKAAQRATEAIAHTDEAIESITNQVFQLYSNLLMDEARRPWNKILGNKLTLPHGSTYVSQTHQNA
jgi:hypothetical protein